VFFRNDDISFSMFLFTETQKEVLEDVSDQQTSEKKFETSESNGKEVPQEKKDPSTDKEAQEGLSSSSASQKTMAISKSLISLIKLVRLFF
jgi:hypothetical protein